MRRGQPTLLFSFTVLVGLARVFAYAGTPIGKDLSPAALAEFAALHVLAFALAALVVGAFSRATATRAAHVALYAQAVLFLAPFVDVGLGLPLVAYEDTYVAGVGSAGALVAGIAYAAVVGWGVWDASLGGKGARRGNAVLAAAVSLTGLALLAVPWIRPLVLTYVTWAVRLGLAVYYGVLVCVLLALAVRVTNPTVHRQFWRRSDAAWLPAFALLPFAGLALAGLFSIPAGASDSLLRLKLDAPYMGTAAAVGALLWTQRRIVREAAWGRMRIELAAIVKVVLLLTAFLLGWTALLAALLAASLVWLERDRTSVLVVGVLAALAVLIGNLTAEAVDFADLAVGPAIFTVSVAQWAWPTALGVVAAVAAGLIVAGVAWVTSRTSASGTSRASS